MRRRAGTAQMSAVAIINQPLRVQPVHLRRFGWRWHFCLPNTPPARTIIKVLGDWFQVQRDDLAIHAGLRAGQAHRAPKQLIGMYSAEENGAGRCGCNAWFRAWIT